jgi:hypothetical protein
MRKGLRRWWPWLKLTIGLLIVFFIARQFLRDLWNMDRTTLLGLHFGWLALSAVLYLAGLGVYGTFWRRLLGRLGGHPPWGASLRAYYLGHFGKYIPGKAWALFLRASIIHSHGVRLALSVLTSLYEVLTTMASGALLAAVLFAFLHTATRHGLDVRYLLTVVWEQPADAELSRTEAVVLALCLVAVTALPLQPVFFNRLTRRLIHHPTEHPHPPHIRFVWFLEGLGTTALGWLLLGASLAAALQAIAPGPYATPATLGRLAAALSCSYVAGFVVLFTSNGLGVREFFLALFIAPELEQLLGIGAADARVKAVLAVIVLRLVWTMAEVMLAGCLFWMRPIVPIVHKTDKEGDASSVAHRPASTDPV